MRQIDADKLKERLDLLKIKDEYTDDDRLRNLVLNWAIEEIDNAPTITTIDETFSTVLDKYGDNTFSVSVISSKGEKIDFERKRTGKWVLDSIGCYCSECKKHPDVTTDYCPFCGADMRSVDEGLHERAVSDLRKTVDDLYKKLRGDV